MGRHREFDVENALDAALSVFWQKGYEGTSFEDLTSATGVARPSLYRVFGNKEALFLKALDRYDARYMAFWSEALEKSNSFEVVEHALRGSANVLTMDPAHPGCLGIHGALACSKEGEPIRQELIRRRGLLESALRRRFEKARDAGELSRSVDCAALAAFVMTITHGMAVQAKAGTPREMLDAIVEQVLISWPSANPDSRIRRDKRLRAGTRV